MIRCINVKCSSIESLILHILSSQTEQIRCDTVRSFEQIAYAIRHAIGAAAVAVSVPITFLERTGSDRFEGFLDQILNA